MSMHKKPLTRLEELGLLAHALDIGTPSQLSDVFRQGVAWALSQMPKPTGEVFDLTVFAKRMDEEMRKHDCFGFEAVVYAIAEEVLCSDHPPAWWQFFQDGEWHMGFKHPANHRENTVEAGYPVRNLYAGPVIGLKVGCTSCEPAGVFDVDGSGPWNCPDCEKVAQVGTGVSVSKEDLLAWRKDWLVEHDPEDGTDCVTPFDKYLYGGQLAQQASDSEDAQAARINDWFLSLPEGRQAFLLTDKWILAHAAFKAGQNSPKATQVSEQPVKVEAYLIQNKEKPHMRGVRLAENTDLSCTDGRCEYLELMTVCQHHQLTATTVPTKVRELVDRVCSLIFMGLDVGQEVKELRALLNQP